MTEQSTQQEAGRELAEELPYVAKFLRDCRGSEPWEMYEDHAKTVDAAARLLREQAINFERLVQVVAEIRARERSLERERETLRAALLRAKASEHWHPEQCTFCDEITTTLSAVSPDPAGAP